MILRGKKFSIDSVAPVVVIPDDEDPFLNNWNTGNRISGKIPIGIRDIYLENNNHQADTFPELIDGSTATVFGDNFFNNDDYNPPIIRIDIRKYKARLTHVRIYARVWDGPTSFYYVEKGTFNKVLLGTISGSVVGWFQFNLPDGGKDVTWIVYEMFNKAGRPNEMELHGSYITVPVFTPSANRGQKFKNMNWTNCFQWNVLADGGLTVPQQIELLSQHSGIRHYLDRYHIEDAKGNYTFSPSSINHGSWDFDSMYQILKDNNIDVRVVVKSVPLWLQAYWPEELRRGEQLPVEYETDQATTIAKAYLPESYLAEGKMWFQFAARYGSTVVPDELLIVHDVDANPFYVNVKRTGLNLVNKIELTNEPDSWWQGWAGYQVSRQIAARMSCCYDGHKNTMGPGVGAKNADPNINFSFPGLGNATIETYKVVVDWSREHRGYREDGSVDVPFDCVNYHQYSNDGGSIQNGNATTRGMAPEISGYEDKMKVFIDFADEFLNGMPVILGEYGFDISQFSDQRAARPMDIGFETADRTVRKMVQAQWMLRTALLGWVNGFHEMQVYMLNDANEYDEYNHYAICGTTEAFGSTVRRPSGYFFYQANQLIGEYLVDEVISKEPYVIRAVDGDDVMYILWSPTEEAFTGTYELILLGVTSITVYTLSLYSIVPTASTIAISNSYIANISESPIFIKINQV